MKKIIILLLLLCLPTICWASSNPCNLDMWGYYPAEDTTLAIKTMEYRPLQTLEYIQYKPVNYYFIEPEDRIYPLIGFVLKTGLCIWGFQQKNAYGNVTGVLFGIGACYNFYEVAW